MDRARASRDNVENVANGGAGRRSNDTDATRKNRQRALQFFRKQSFSLQTIAQLFERDPQGARADRIERVNDELILATRRVDRKLAARADVQTVRRTKRMRVLVERKHLARSCAFSSLSVKYQCPDE